MDVMNIEKQIVFLPTKNLDSTTHFYMNIMGLQLFLDQGDCIIFKSCQNSYIGFCKRSVEIIEGKFILTLIVDNVDEAYVELKSKGFDDISPPVINEKYQIYHFFITDPNGYLVEFQKFLEKINL